MRNKNQTPSRVKFRLILGAIIVAAFITACPNPDQLMDARINDFLSDLAQLDGSSGDNAKVENIVSTHLHPDAQSGDQASAEFWRTSIFNADNAQSYTWTLVSTGDVTGFGGATRRTGTVRVNLGGGDSTPLSNVRFFMKQSGMDWRIRAINDGADDNLFQNIR